MITTYFLNCIAGNVFNTKISPAIPKRYYIGLSTSLPYVDGTGVTEPGEYAGYERIALTSLSRPDNGIITNTENIVFDDILSDWGVVTHFVVFDAPSGGNLLMYGELQHSDYINSGDIVVIKSMSLNFSTENRS